MEHRAHDVTVEPFGPHEADAVAAMMQELAAFQGDEARASASEVLRFASGPDRISTILVATRCGKPCGFSATYDWMNYIHGFPVRNIDLFFVREGARGFGVGRALLSAIARGAKSASCRRLTVGAEPGNAGANAFYRKMGFELRPSAANRYALSGDTLDRIATPPLHEHAPAGYTHDQASQ